MTNNVTLQGNSEQQGKKSNLWLLTSENAIVIPIIQRDYAQGRTNDDVRQIREAFLKKIFKVLGDNNSKLELDFIYGTLETPKDISLKDVDYEDFVPLDGQQRLTSLFLLHWFLSLWNNDDYELMKSHFHGRFSYRTRLSSSEFCAELLEHVCPEDVIESITAHNKNSVSRVLMNEGWFHNQWNNDPTISGMLKTLDTMSSLYKDIIPADERVVKADLFFKRLTGDDVEDSAITFNLLYLNRGDFHLSDELYIKMNSRGKPLSDFETFKARFESFLAKYSSEINDFSARIDGQWADVFWTLRNNIKPKNVGVDEVYYRDNTDGMMMNVIKVSIANKQALLTDNNDYALDELFETQVARKNNPNMHLTFYRYTELGVFNDINSGATNDEDDELATSFSMHNKTVCQCVYDAFRFICEIKEKYKEISLVDSEIVDVDNLLNNILFYGIDGIHSVISSISYQERLIFWALSEYFIKFENQVSGNDRYLQVNRWMKFVRNMVESTEINSVYDMQKALKFLDSVLSSITDGDIISYLKLQKTAPECSPFPQSQIKEEILKAQLIGCDATWEESINCADNVPSWPGRSGYLLYFTGLSEKTFEELCALDNDSHRKFQRTFEAYKNKMDILLSYLLNNNFREECMVERALLSKGCYFRKEDNRSIIYSMMDQSVNSRSYSFRQMIQFNGIDYQNDNTTYKEGVDCLKSVLDDDLFNIDDVKTSLKNIINDSLSNVTDWRYPLIKNSRIWSEAYERFLWIDNNGTSWVVRKKGGATNQYETWSYYLYLQLVSNGLLFKYYPHSYPRHTILNFKIEEQMYQLKIRHTSTGEWRFDMIAIDENYHEQPLDSKKRRIVFSLMPNNAQTFFKKNMTDTIIWAKAMSGCISRVAEVF